MAIIAGVAVAISASPIVGPQPGSPGVHMTRIVAAQMKRSGMRKQERSARREVHMPSAIHMAPRYLSSSLAGGGAAAVPNAATT